MQSAEDFCGVGRSARGAYPVYVSTRDEPTTQKDRRLG